MAFHWKLRQGYFLQLCDSLGQQSRAQWKQEPTDQVNAKTSQNITKWCKQDKWLLYLRLYCFFWPPVRLPMPQFVKKKSRKDSQIVFWKSRVSSTSGLGVLPCCFSLLQATTVQAFTNLYKCITYTNFNAFSVNSEMIQVLLVFLTFLATARFILLPRQIFIICGHR